MAERIVPVCEGTGDNVYRVERARGPFETAAMDLLRLFGFEYVLGLQRRGRIASLGFEIASVGHGRLLGLGSFYHKVAIAQARANSPRWRERIRGFTGVVAQRYSGVYFAQACRLCVVPPDSIRRVYV